MTFRDTQHILVVLLNLLFYMTPVFYTRKVVPSNFQWLYQLNPIAHLIDAYRSILVYTTAPDWIAIGALTLVTVLCLPIGHFLFRLQSDRFVEEL